MAKQNKMIGKTVTMHDGQFEGVVTAVHTITFLGDKTVVYDVKWNGPETPLKCKDEKGTNKQGYRISSFD